MSSSVDKVSVCPIFVGFFVSLILRRGFLPWLISCISIGSCGSQSASLGWLQPLPRGLDWCRLRLLLARMRIGLYIVSSRPLFLETVHISFLEELLCDEI